MKNFLLSIASIFMLGCLVAEAKVAPKIPKFIHGTYSVESLLSKQELTDPGYDVFQFIYLMATPKWKDLDFDQPRDSIIAYADQFDYKTQTGKMPLVPVMIEKAHKSKAKILLCFGGQKEFIQFVEKPERIDRFTDYVVRLVENNNYDGVDIDWEITLDKVLHIDMMRQLRDKLNTLSKKTQTYYYLTTALSLDHVYDQQLADKLSATVDWINIMSYDLCDGVWGRTPSHNTSMEVIRTRIKNWDVFDRKKLCVGLANYGFYYKGLKPGERADRRLDNYGSYITYKEFIPKMSQGWTEEYDPQAEVSYYFSPDRNEFVTIDSPSSILTKIDWVKNNGFLGVFWWEFHHDFVAPTAENSRGSHYLIDGVTKYLKRK